jgi:cell division protein FtsB
LNKARAAAPQAPAELSAPANISAKPLSYLSARNFFVLFGVALVTIFVVGIMVRSNHLAVSHSYEISELTQHKMDLLETNRQLKTELAQVGSLEHLEKAARKSLGLITPRQGQIVVIE